VRLPLIGAVALLLISGSSTATAQVRRCDCMVQAHLPECRAACRPYGPRPRPSRCTKIKGGKEYFCP
jgi:hypothetical protein